MVKKIIIVGASSGIGHELAKIYSNTNCLVGITGRRIDKLEELKATNPSKFHIKTFDCTSDNNSEKLKELVDELGGFDLLILSSGTGELNPDLEYKLEQATIDLNVSAFTEIVDWAYNFFDQQGVGQIAAISSVGGLRGSGIAPSYNASKAYQINYLEGLRQKAKQSKKPIYITDIRPGLVDTDMAKGEGLFWVSPKEKAAKQIYTIIQKKKEIGYVTKRWILIALLLKIIPNWIYKRM
ncbi:MAG: SDR family NAD(P)-dependent oxidoreductase [Urechidicola sp.]|nr:SDR family NAD(P)-dependent oxidoreductase [Urechidicola sp.]